MGAFPSELTPHREHSLLHPQHRQSTRQLHTNAANPNQAQAHQVYTRSYTPFTPQNIQPSHIPNNTIYNTQAPAQNTYSNETLYGKLEDRTAKRFLTQDPSAGTTKFPLHKTISNPFNSYWQRLRFALTPRAPEHRNRQPWNVPIERFINRCYNTFMVWWDIRTPKQRILPIALPLIPSFFIYAYIRSESNVPKLVPVDPSVPYHPILPDKHIPYRSALLPHTLPGHLNGSDALFMKDYVDYDASKIVRPETLPRWEGVNYAFGRTSVGTYRAAVQDWGTERPLGGTDLRKPLVHDVPKLAERYDVWPQETLDYNEEEIRASMQLDRPKRDEELRGLQIQHPAGTTVAVRNPLGRIGLTNMTIEEAAPIG